METNRRDKFGRIPGTARCRRKYGRITREQREFRELQDATENEKEIQVNRENSGNGERSAEK
jgi:hypothetical protein